MEQKTTDTIEQVTDKVLEKLIEDEDFIAGRFKTDSKVILSSFLSVLQRQMRSRRLMLYNEGTDGKH